jgi:hypothetical protein
MASTQLTGSAIITLARTFCNDDDAAGNYAISNAKALVLLNDILARYAHCFSVQPRYFAASTTGLTFPAGTTTVLTNTSTDWTFDLNGITSAHQTNSSVLATVLANGLPTDLERLTVPEIIAKFGRDNQDDAIPSSSSDWMYWAAEREGDSTENATGYDKWRFWVYPALNRTQYLTLKGVEKMHLASASNIPNLTSTDAQYVSRLLAYEMSARQPDMNPTFMQAIVAPLPKSLREFDYNAATPASQGQDSVEWTED